MLSDTDFVEMCLREGPASNLEILARSFAARGQGCTVHSRVADVRRRLPEGWTITCQRIPGRRGRPEYRYEIVEPASEQLAFGEVA